MLFCSGNTFMRTTHLVCIRGSIVRSHQGKLYVTDKAHGNIVRDSDTQDFKYQHVVDSKSLYIKVQRPSWMYRMPFKFSLILWNLSTNRDHVKKDENPEHICQLSIALTCRSSLELPHDTAVIFLFHKKIILDLKKTALLRLKLFLNIKME